MGRGGHFSHLQSSRKQSKLGKVSALVVMVNREGEMGDMGGRWGSGEQQGGESMMHARGLPKFPCWKACHKLAFLIAKLGKDFCGNGNGLVRVIFFGLFCSLFLVIIS